jgi:hypothetical protein
MKHVFIMLFEVTYFMKCKSVLGMLSLATVDNHRVHYLASDLFDKQEVTNIIPVLYNFLFYFFSCCHFKI